MSRFFIYLLLLVSLLACKKEDPTDLKPIDLTQLPPVSSEGCDLLGMFVNDRLHVIRNINFNFNPFVINSFAGGLSIVDGDTSLVINGHLDNQCLDQFSIKSPIKNGEALPMVSEPGNYYNCQSDQLYILDTLFPHELDLHFWDQTSKIIAGTFSFRVIDETTPDTLVIRDGRFDFRYE